MGRFTTVTFTTASVPSGGGVVDHELTILSNTLDISKLKITPSIAAGNNIVQIYRKATRGVSDLLYTTSLWANTVFVDPGDHAAAEFNGGWVAPYFDKDESLKLHFRFKNYHTVAKTYTVVVEYEYISTDDPGIIGAPEGLLVQAVANGLHILSGVIATRNTSTITEAEFRAKKLATGEQMINQDLRLVSEGGAFVPDGVSNLSIVAIHAGAGGAQYSWTALAQGRWYYTWRLKNSVGWSRWSDGNVTPSNVPHWVKTQDFSDTGPPSDWEVWTEEGPNTGTIIVHATRPKVNGNTLLWWIIQVRDADSGSWVALDSGTTPSEVKYDGSLVDHGLANNGQKITKATSGWGTAQAGDLILLDVRGGNFDVNYCQWGLVDIINGNALEFTSSGWRPQVTTGLRLKIVKPPWTWTGSGYLGSEANHGMWGQNTSVNSGLGEGWILGKPDTEFTSEAIIIPTAVTNPEARVWFENTYCRSDDNRYSTGLSGGKATFTGLANFYDFNNRNYWLPIYPGSTWGTLTFNKVTGACTMATKTNQAAHYGQSGVRARWRLHADGNGEFMVYAKWTDVTFPVGAAAADILGLGIVLIWNVNYHANTSGVCAIIKGTSASQMILNAPYLWIKQNVTTTGMSGDPWLYTGSYNIARPVAGSIFELRATFQKHSYYGYNAVQPIEMRVGGSGVYTSLDQTWDDEGSNIETGGVDIFIGWIGNCRLTGATAKLVQFSLIKGLGEFY